MILRGGGGDVAFAPVSPVTGSQAIGSENSSPVSAITSVSPATLLSSATPLTPDGSLSSATPVSSVSTVTLAGPKMMYKEISKKDGSEESLLEKLKAPGEVGKFLTRLNKQPQLDNGVNVRRYRTMSNLAQGLQTYSARVR